MGKMIKAMVTKPIRGFGYFANQEGSFSEDVAEELIKGGYISIPAEPETTKETVDLVKKTEVEKKAKK